MWSIHKVLETMTTFFKAKRVSQRKAEEGVVGVIFDEKLQTRKRSSLLSRFIFIAMEREKCEGSRWNNKFIENELYYTHINNILFYFHYINWFDAWNRSFHVYFLCFSLLWIMFVFMYAFANFLLSSRAILIMPKEREKQHTCFTTCDRVSYLSK